MFRQFLDFTARIAFCKTYGHLTIPLPFKILVEKSQIVGENLIITFRRL
jgi:hypothetical protein